MFRRLERIDKRFVLKITLFLLFLLFLLSQLTLLIDRDVWFQVISVIGVFSTVYGVILTIIDLEKIPLLREHLDSRTRFLRWTIENRVKTYFMHSLEGAIELILGKELAPQFMHQIDLIIRGNNEDVTLPEDMSIETIFNLYHSKLVILGAPGSGKTFTSRQLLRKIAQDSLEDYNKAIPVFLNLSSWGMEQLALEYWIQDEIYKQVGIRRKIVEQWLEEDMLILILDALDEVPTAKRQFCADAINTFIQKNRQTKIVVTCRYEEYSSLITKLEIPTTISLLPLKRNQIDIYLSVPDLKMKAVRELLDEDENLLKLAETPLLLRVMTLAYSGMTRQEIDDLLTIEKRLRHLFHSYINRMFEHRPLNIGHSYDKYSACRWLSNIAKQMDQDGLSEFYIERFSPSWLSGVYLSWYRFLVPIVGILLVLPIGSFAIIYSLSTILNIVIGEENSFISTIIGVGFGALYFLIGSPTMAFDKENFDVLIRAKLRLRFPTSKELLNFLGLRLLIGVVLGVLTWMFLDFVGTFKPLESYLQYRFPSSRIYLLVSYGWIDAAQFVSIVSIVVMFSVGLTAGFIVGAMHLTHSITDIVDVTERLRPNLGIHLSSQNAIRMAIAYFLILTPALTVIIGVCLFLFGDASIPITDIWQTLGVIFLLNGAVIANGGWWISGGRVILQHYCIRWLLQLADVLPYALRTNMLVGYLDSMSERLLLRRIGGGWEFYHRYLQDHFASR